MSPFNVILKIMCRSVFSLLLINCSGWIFEWSDWPFEWEWMIRTLNWLADMFHLIVIRVWYDVWGEIVRHLLMSSLGSRSQAVGRHYTEQHREYSWNKYLAYRCKNCADQTLAGLLCCLGAASSSQPPISLSILQINRLHHFVSWYLLHPNHQYSLIFSTLRLISRDTNQWQCSHQFTPHSDNTWYYGEPTQNLVCNLFANITATNDLV